MSARPLVCSLVILSLALSFGCAQDGTDEVVDTSSLALPGVGHPRSDLVVVRDGRLLMDRFLRCDLKEAEAATSLQLLVHSEASSQEISRDRFVARSALAVQDAVRGIGAESSAAAGRPHCHEIEAPEGDVDWEISLAVSASDVETSVEKVEPAGDALPTASHSNTQCQRNAMGNQFCCTAPNGVAITDNLGNVRCARGQCVRSPMGEWHCARASGGWAELDPRGQPVCERGCYSPSSTQCRRM